MFDTLKATLCGYCNLEIDVLERRRGVRGPGVTNLIRQLTGAEDAVVVNNNAAALFLLLSTFASGKEVIVSRGELVQIGGGFRIPDILKNAGAVLKEVGTTNITTSKDYMDAVTDETAMILKVHQANFSMHGFVASPSIRELLRAGCVNVPIVSDLGSGNMVKKIGGRCISEPTPEEMLKEGAALVSFSTDKMLGAVQGGIIAGKGALVDRLKRHPVMRVVRVDKLTFGILQTVLGHYLAGEPERIALWQMVETSANTLAARVESFVATHGLPKDVFVPVETEATFGGGATPGTAIPSYGLGISAPKGPDTIAAFFQKRSPPVIGTVRGDLFVIDFRTVLEADEALLAQSCIALAGNMGSAVRKKEHAPI
jgi:L-seryl-tRNA(Ser) seleniumtransferase